MNMTSIFLIVADTCRRDRIQPYSHSAPPTPNINELFSQSIVFSSAYSTSSWTVPAHGSLFTGELPHVHGATANQRKLNAQNLHSLPAKLSYESYSTAAISANPWISSKFGFDTGFEFFVELFPELPYPEYDPRKINWEYESGMSRILERARWLLSGPRKSLRNLISIKQNFTNPIPSGKKLNKNLTDYLDKNKHNNNFVYLNYMDVHDPYDRPDLKEYHKNNDVNVDSLDIKWNARSLLDTPDQPSEIEVNRAYDSAVQSLDDHIGNLIKELEDRNLWNDSLIIFLSDHGQCLGENGFYGHGVFLYDSLVEIPLAISLPNQQETIEVTRATSLTIIPELLTSDYFLDGDLDMDSFREYIDSKDSVAGARTYGVPDKTELPDSIACSSGYQGLFTDENSLRRNLCTGEVTWREGTDQTLINIEDEIFSGETQNQNSTDADISAEMKKHLQDLGYM